MHVSEIDTPALVVDLNVMERNLHRVAAYTREHGLRLRPHTKTHKSVRLGKRQLHEGAAGLTVAKVSEAEVMLGASPADLLIAYPIIGRSKLQRLVEVAKRTNVTVAVDSMFAAQQISDAAAAAHVEIGILAEVDVGLGRVGVTPGEPLMQLAKAIVNLPNLIFDGITFYPGHIKDMDEKGRQALDRLNGLLDSILTALRGQGIEPRIVSGGSTPTLYHSHEIAGLNEIRPGTYVFNDINTVHSKACALEDCAATVHATVVSTRPGHMIIDGGSKTFSSDRLSVGSEVTFGRLVEAPEARFYKMNEEHGYVDLSNTNAAFKPGDRVRVIPNHICVAVNLHEQVHGVRGETVEDVWRVDGRGKLQ